MSGKGSGYQKKLIRHLYFSRALSCAHLSAAIKKSLPLTTRILNELIADGTVTEVGHAVSTGGRRPVMYALKQDMQFIVSVAMDQYITRIALMDMANNFITGIEKFEMRLPGNARALTELSAHIEAFIKRTGLPKEKIAGIGIGAPGFVDFKKGINYSFLSNGLQSITEHISRQTGIATYIDNDSSLIALAELHFGAARRRKNAMVVNLSWGVGLGMVLDGQLYRGHNGFAGEFSHIPIFSNGKLCSCGKSGCLETETSLLVIIEKAKEKLRNGQLSILTLQQLENYEEAWEKIVHALGVGDRFAAELFSEVGYNIGRGVAILIHVLNPEVIVLSGRGSSAGRIWHAPVQQALNEHCIPRMADNTSIEMSTFGYDAELIGAACLVMEHYDKELKPAGSKSDNLVTIK